VACANAAISGGARRKRHEGQIATGKPLLASFVKLVSGELMRSSIEPKSILDSLTGVLLRVIAGLPSDAERLAGSEDPGQPKICGSASRA